MIMEIVSDFFFAFICHDSGHHLDHALFSSQSYWHWLPPEIQEHIISLANRQQILDMNKELGRDKLNEAILIYHRLKQVWGLRHIKVKIQKCGVNYCPARVTVPFLKNHESRKHTNILGYYVDRQNRPTYDFLGHTFEEAFRRMSYVKMSIKLFQ